MKSVARLTIALTLVSQAALAGPYQGSYRGYINGGGRDSVTTFTPQGGKMLGSYYMTETQSTGTISKLKMKDNVLTGQWHDQFGEGPVRFEFNSALDQFFGCWAPKKTKLKNCYGQNEWSGKRSNEAK